MTIRTTASSRQPTLTHVRLAARWVSLAAAALLLIAIPFSGAHVHSDGARHDHCALCGFAYVAAVVAPSTVILEGAECAADEFDAPVPRGASAPRMATASRAPPAD